MMPLRLASAALLAALLGAPAAAQQPTADPWPPATLPLTETHVFRSGVNGREYHVAVALPMRYRAPGADTVRYPVLYVLDGGAHLPLLASMFRFTNRSGGNGDVIMVGIGYYEPGAFTPPPTGQPAPRTIDYLPPAYPAAGVTQAGRPAGAAGFHRILRDEVIPLIDRRYRTSADRALHGHSLGGLFATYVLFEDPDLFTRYAIISPAYQWVDQSMFSREAAFRRTRSGLGKEVYLSAGALEGPRMIGDMWRMVAALCEGRRAGSYAGLAIRAEVVPDEHHNSSVLFGRALKALYPPFAAPAGEDVCTVR